MEWGGRRAGTRPPSITSLTANASACVPGTAACRRTCIRTIWAVRRWPWVRRRRRSDTCRTVTTDLGACLLSTSSRGRGTTTATGLYYYGARDDDPIAGRFISADSIVPSPGNPQALNRYSYALNNPLRYIDPSGNDPLDAAWEDAFREEHDGRSPDDTERQQRLYSLLYAGPVSGAAAWSNDDWAAMSLPTAWKDAFESTAGRQTLDDLANAVERLAAWYEDGETPQFVSALALLYAGVAYQPGDGVAILRHGFGGAVTNRYLSHGMQGFSPNFYRLTRHGPPEENTHHYAGTPIGRLLCRVCR